MLKYEGKPVTLISETKHMAAFLNRRKLTARKNYCEATFLFQSIMYENNLYADKPAIVFDVSDLTCKFDALLHYSMLQCALWDRVDGNRSLFYVKDLSKRDEVYKFLDDEKYLDIDMSDILYTRRPIISGIIEMYIDDMTVLSDKFVEEFKNAELTKDYTKRLSMIKDCVLKIMQTLSAKDVTTLENYGFNCLILKTLDDLNSTLTHKG